MSRLRFVGGCLGRMGFLFLLVRGFFEGGGLDSVWQVFWRQGIVVIAVRRWGV